jgi:27-O-demethylrifamycin SV methyltransferase
MLQKIFPHPAPHYDRISDAWRHIFGEQFHFGLFDSPDADLEEATDALTDRLSALSEITGESRVLDVGCGIGGPAFRLHRKTGCSVLGVSTSRRGVELARNRSGEFGLDGAVRFRVADGTDSGLPDGSYDVTWVQESSHLMNKRKLFRECHRVLRRGGALLLCDVMLRRRFTPVDHVRFLWRLRAGYPAGILSMKKAYGRGRAETFAFYEREIRRAGFAGLEVVDVSDAVRPTMGRWRENVERNRKRIGESFSRENVDDFVRGTELLDELFAAGIWGYGLIRGVKE